MKYFGTDGFRGEANNGLNVEHAFKIGRFIGWYYGALVPMRICFMLSLRPALPTRLLTVALIAA